VTVLTTVGRVKGSKGEQVGRPSLAAVRREELLDAVEACITAQGVAGTTVAAVAKLAGTQPSKVHHYLGSRSEMLTAAVERAVRRVEELVVDAMTNTPSHQRLETQLAVLFGDGLTAPEVNQLIDHLVAASYLDVAIHSAVSKMYQRFLEILRDSIEAAYPAADPSRRQSTAMAILALAHASPTIDSLAIDPDTMRHNYKAANALLRQL
jgi:AcrR family transcriptional regulator